MRPENHAPGADAAPLLEVENLAVAFTTMNGPVQAVHEASLTLHEGRTLAIVGESGSGKSTTAMSVIGLLPGNGRVTGGSVRSRARSSWAWTRFGCGGSAAGRSVSSRRTPCPTSTP